MPAAAARAAPLLLLLAACALAQQRGVRFGPSGLASGADLIVLPGCLDAAACLLPVRGARFVDVCALNPKEFEGAIIRVIRRLEELTRQLADAAKAIGDEALQAKFTEASGKMRRNIVFAASLYL